MINTVSVLGLLMVIIGYVPRYMIARRQFYRRNAYGINEWHSYEHYKFGSYFEKKIRQVCWLFMAAGWVLIAVTVINYYSAKQYRESNSKASAPKKTTQNPR